MRRLFKPPIRVAGTLTFPCRLRISSFVHTLAAIAFVLSLLVGAPCAALAESHEMSAEARAVFDQAKDKLVQIRVLHKATGAQRSIGSGFLASADGLVLTNYHVVSDAALEPGTYELELQRSGGTNVRPRLLAVDVANDLAVLSTGASGQPFLAIRATPLEKGDRGFALGHPLQLGMAIVEGTYNGHAEATVVPRIHFTGALNPGMSGGPAIAPDGKVFGINVSHLWLQQLVSFLVPAEAAADLLRRASVSGAPPADFRQEVGAQLLAQQARLFERLLAEPVTTSVMGRYTVPDASSAYIRCWGTAQDDPEKLYGRDVKRCYLNGLTYVDDALQMGELSFVHAVFESRGLGALRFASLMEDRYSTPYAGQFVTSRKALTGFRCHDDFVSRPGGTLRVTLCSRAYKSFAGLYDFHLRALTVDSDSSALLTTVTVSGVSFENGVRCAGRHREAISWTN